MRFGEFLKELRLKNKLSLRSFCIKVNADPGNISKVERGVIAPSFSDERLKHYAEGLGLAEGDEDWFTFFDLAAAEKGIIPKDIRNKLDVEALPIFFRSMRNEKLDEDAIRSLIEKLKEAGL